MKAVVWHGPRDIMMEERPKPVAGAGQVLIQTAAVGICGSDMKLFEYGVLGTYKPAQPFIMGHEATGWVVELGAGVSGIAVGQRVIINPQASCGKCFYCRQGAQNLCEALDFKSVTGDGVFSDYVVVRADQALPLAEHISFEAGTAIEPLSVTVQAARQALLNAEDQVLIYGAGTIGLLLMQVLQNQGIKKIVMVDTLNFALGKACKQGAVAAINPRETDTQQVVKELFGKNGPDVVFDTAGSSITQAQTIEIVRPGGTAVLVGITQDAAACVNMNRVVRSNLRLLGTVRTSGDAFLEASRLIAARKVDPGVIIDKILPFADAEDGFKAVEDRSHCITKCVLKLI